MYTDLQLYIDGEWLNGKDRKGEEVMNPATGKSLGTLPHASRCISAGATGLLGFTRRKQAVELLFV